MTHLVYLSTIFSRSSNSENSPNSKDSENFLLRFVFVKAFARFAPKPTGVNHFFE